MENKSCYGEQMDKLSLAALRKTPLSLICAMLLIPSIANSLSLEEAVVHTLDTHLELNVAFSNLKLNEKQINQGGYWLTTNVNGDIGYEYTDNPSAVKFYDNHSEEIVDHEVVTLKSNLFNDFHIASEVYLTNYESNAEQWRLHGFAEDIALQAIETYINLVKDQALVDLSEKYLTTNLHIQEQVKQLRHQGVGDVADISVVNASVTKAELNLVTVKDDYLNSKVEFYVIIEKKPENLAVPVPNATLLPETKEKGLIQALQFHPVIKSAYNDIDAATHRHESVKSTYYPNLSFEIATNYNDRGESGNASLYRDDQTNQTSSMFPASYNIFSGGEDAADKMAEVQQVNRELHRKVTDSFILYWDSYQQLMNQKSDLNSAVDDSKDKKSSFQELLKNGDKNLLDLLTVEDELYQARRALLNVEFSEMMVRYRVLHATGLLLDGLRTTRTVAWKVEN